MAQLLQPETGTTDPRILRSRRMLMEALAKLLMKKEFEDISVQEIADEAVWLEGDVGRAVRALKQSPPRRRRRP